MDEQSIKTFKIMLLGASGSGKTAFYEKYFDIDNSYISTADDPIFRCKYICIQHQKAKLQVWDIPGMERFKLHSPSQFKNTHAFLIFFDICDRNSFHYVITRYKSAQHLNNLEGQPFIIANKIDTDIKHHCVSYAEGKDLADELGAQFYECSGKKNIGTDKIMNDVAAFLLDSYALKNTITEIPKPLPTKQEKKGVFSSFLKKIFQLLQTSASEAFTTSSKKKIIIIKLN